MRGSLKTRSKNLLRKDLIDKKVIRNLLKLTQVYFVEQTKPKSTGVSEEMIENLAYIVKCFLEAETVPSNLSFPQILGEISSLVYASRAKKLLKFSKDLALEKDLDEACRSGDLLKSYKASMKVEERDYLFGSASVVIGKILYKSSEHMRKVFRDNARISKAGDDNSDLIGVYEEAMNSKI